MHSDWSEIKIRLKLLEAQPALNLRPRYNAAPTSDLPVAHLDKDGNRVAEIMRWGLVPSWAEDIKLQMADIELDADAAVHAAMRADALLDKGDLDGCKVWKRIVKAINSMDASKPMETAH